MGIYVKGMEMPHHGEFSHIRIYDNGDVTVEVDTGKEVYEAVIAHAVQLPPHGRLIDASEKIKVQMYDDMTEDYHMVEMTIDDLLCQGWVEANAPSIIEAEVGDAQ